MTSQKILGQKVKEFRNELNMTQAQLADRAGLSQPHIAHIEKGDFDPQLGTLNKIFDALYTDLVILPKPRKDLDKIKEDQIRRVAEQRVRRVAGTMALEKQSLDQAAQKTLLKEATAQLRRKSLTHIWDSK